MSQAASTDGQPTSFKTNVNRAKTKRWVEAKSYSYDGDDWGDVDDYDEYGGYDEPPPPSKPTGLRQRGQSASQGPQDGYDHHLDIYQSPVDNRRTYGDLGGIPQQQQQQYGGRSVTNPQSQYHAAMQRTNSFDHGEERRAFSSGGSQQYSDNVSQAPITKTSAPQGQNTSSVDFQDTQAHASQAVPVQAGPSRPPGQFQDQPRTEDRPKYIEQARSPGESYRGVPSHQPRNQTMDSRSQSMTSNVSSSDFHDRRDFSPSAMPPPLQTRSSPSPHRSLDSRSSSRPPPRKSSLTREVAPTVPLSSHVSPQLATGDIEENIAPTRARAGSNADKQLPFVRPSDIYRRMHEEKERERQSQESSRPRMDSILGKSNERPSLDKRRDSESAQQLKSTLDPVSERKREYGLEGMTPNNFAEAEKRRPTSSKTFEMPKRASNGNTQGNRGSLQQPVLPDVSRVSGFGESFFGITDHSATDPQPPPPDFGPSPSQPKTHDTTSDPTEQNLRTQPSLGFTSAVHQAFDKAADQVPPTPSSTASSTVGRSTSGGTSVVSPIISRGPSAATESRKSELPGIDDVTASKRTKPESGGNDSRPTSSESLGTPKQTARKPSPSQAMPLQSFEDLPPSFIPGYRRNSNTPSPDNSPAKTPSLEVNRPLRQPQEVEVSAATPTDPDSSTASSSHDSDVAPKEELSKELTRTAENDATVVPPNAGSKSGSTTPPTLPPHNFLRDRTDSSSSGRVRNLADRFESGSRPGSAHSTTPRASTFGVNVQRKDDLVPPRPLTDRMESFRPHLPGGWESSASIAPAPVLDPGSKLQSEQESNATSIPPNDWDIISSNQSHPHPEEASSSISQIKDASEEAFAAVAAAGSALAGAFGAAVGTEKHGSSTGSPEESTLDEDSHRRLSGDLAAATRDRTASVNTVLHPDAAKPYQLPLSENGLSTEAPTPLPLDHLQELSQSTENPDYIQTSLSNQEGPDNGSRPIAAVALAKQIPKLPLLSTDNKHHEYESDRLRREIVRELNPMPASGVLPTSEPTTAESDYSHYQSASRSSTNPSMTHPGHESGVLPTEYESYWNDGNSDIGTSEPNGGSSQIEATMPVEQQQQAAAVGEPLRPTTTREHAIPIDDSDLEPSLPSHQVSTVPVNKTGPPQDLRQNLPHRFSWEHPLAKVPAQPEPLQDPPIITSSGFLQSSIYPDGRSFQPQDGSSSHSEGGESSTVKRAAGPVVKNPPSPSKIASSAPQNDEHQDQYKEGLEGERDLVKHPDGLEKPGPLMEKEFFKAVEPGMAEAVGSTDHESPISQNQIRQVPESPRQTTLTNPVQDTDLSSTSEQNQTALPTQTRDATLPAAVPPVSAQQKSPAFREILALKNPSERIRAFNETREQFAQINTGLAHWLAVTTEDLPEHADLLVSTGRPAPNFQAHSRTKSKLGAFLPTGGSGQQTSTPTADGAVSGSLGGGPSPGFSISGGSGSKISSQQVQAKGKDLVRSAGVFGGKANVAAKGLFSKGKSKLRGGSGAEKALTPPHSPDSLSRGMLPQPQSTSFEAQIPSHNLPQPSPGGVLDIMPSTAPQSSTSSEAQQSPRDAPSLKSFSQSQLGDDERSEESGSANQGYLPRLSSFYNKDDITSRRQNQTLQQPVDTRRGAALVLQEILPIDSQPKLPQETYSPRSATSSNQTPTQAHFLEADKRAVSFLPSGTQNTHNQSGSVEDVRMLQGTETADSYTRSFSPPQPTQPLQERSNLADLPTNIATPEQPDSYTPARKSDGIFRTTNSFPQTVPGSRHTNGTLVFDKTPSSMENSHRRQPQDYPSREPSIDSNPSRIDLDRPPSPLSPQQPTMREALQQRGRNPPIHRDIDYDFVPGSEQARARSRSRSLSRPPVEYGQLSQDSRRLVDPNIGDHPAFRSTSAAVEDTEVKPRSKRGSRNSAFLKSFSKSSKAGSPALAPRDSHASSSPVTSPMVEEKQGRRSSVFRSLKGNAGNGSESVQSKENIAPGVQALQSAQPTQTSPQILHPMVDDSPSRSESGRFSNKLQRAATSGKAEKDGGKKNRFSAIGSLFGRSNQQRQHPAEQSRSNVLQKAAQRQSQDVSNPTPPPLQQPTETTAGNSVSVERSTQPPPGGYYAPTRADFPSNQAFVDYKMSSQRQQPNAQPSSRALDTPAYIQDSTLRQRATERMSPPSRETYNLTPKPAATFPRQSQDHPSPSVPQTLTYPRSMEREPFQQRPSGNSWTRFSQRGRSQGGQPQHQPPSNTATPSPSPLNPPATRTTPSSGRNTQPAPRRSFHEPSRSGTPPPPPLPPKDDWHRPKPRASIASNNIPSASNITNPNPQIPSQQRSTIRTVPTTQDQRSLSPLQTDMPPSSPRRSGPGSGSGKTMSPEEKRRSRQQEIEQGVSAAFQPRSPRKINSGAKPPVPTPREVAREEKRRSRQQEIEHDTANYSPARVHAERKIPGEVVREDRADGEGKEVEEEEIVMSATSFPGHVWEPDYGAWEGD